MQTPVSAAACPAAASLWSSVNGIDLLLFALGAAIMAGIYEIVLHRQRKRFDRRLDATWDRAYDEGWTSGWRDRRVLGDALSEVMAEEREARRP